MNRICTTLVVVKILEFFPWIDDLFKLFYLNRLWRNTILDVIKNTNFLIGKTTMRLKNKNFILLILKYINGSHKTNQNIIDRFSYLTCENFKISSFPNVLGLIIVSSNLNPPFFNYIHNIFPNLIYLKLIIKSPVCIPLLKNFCFYSKNLKYIIICFVNNELNEEYKDKLKKSINNFLFHWHINVKLITE
ncbi:conserved Plasmodium protein, unknown function [Plasmodium gallinaceum]|uniref:F-box domain-containing protein n=1 Tax=Plasmodium gallinaceum TaxID=5849 RepID=A0A1J1GWH2_PLAGA|nr:conserved Plasmodium protein, unknown function [Plasmodium gallinaceum]CRG96897.1 conserved Plasmodium protein, unknown function [Plasmodium gallinaceum]